MALALGIVGVVFDRPRTLAIVALAIAVVNAALLLLPFLMMALA